MEDYIALIATLLSVLIGVGALGIIIKQKNNRKNKVTADERQIIANFYYHDYLEDLDNEKLENIEEATYIYLMDEITEIQMLCNEFLSAPPELYIDKVETTHYITELKIFIENNNLNELSNLPNDMTKVIEIITKYYDEKGKWRKN